MSVLRAPNGQTGRTKVCISCRERKYMSEFNRNPGRRDRLDGRCRTCVNRYQKRRYKKVRAPTHFNCVDCGERTRRHKRCTPCREAFQRNAEALLADAPLPVTMCPLPIRGGICRQHLVDGTDRLGRGVTFCPTHGERPVEVQRPAGFVRYDQRTAFQDELVRSVGSAQAKVQEKASHTRTWRNNFRVVGRDRQREIEAA